PWPTTSASSRWPKGSRPTASAASSTRRDATWCRGSCTRRPCPAPRSNGSWSNTAASSPASTTRSRSASDRTCRAGAGSGGVGRPGPAGRRERDHEARSALLPVLDVDATAVVLDDALGQRQTQTGPARVAGPALLEAGEAGEHLLAVLRGDAVAVVGDGQHDPRPLLPDGDHHTAATVAGGVVEKVAHHAGQLVAVAP